MTSYIDATKIRLTEQGSAPATPATGSVIIYAKTDGFFYTKDDAGVETLLGGSSFDITGDTGSDTINSGDTLDFEGAGGITTTVTANKVTVDGSNAGALQLISSGALSGTSVTLSSILATYSALELRIYSKSDNATEAFLTIRVGAGGTPDSTAGNYDRTAFNITNATGTPASDVGAAANILTNCSAGLNGVTLRFSETIVELHNYAATATYKNAIWRHRASVGATAAAQKFAIGGATWRNNSDAIDCIGLTLTAGSFVSGSIYELYGIV